ncbi:LEF-6 [Epiphyas postvittana nucleopolyhedrovirus]|uniref:LEF-6 n=1 Tax=Epiphyas postvittana nucleopolyhedrovirus TaxID=70600 RepID=Q91GL8_NPVEP|nr:LEF-6 [Epiphyas postvittana nucleopolyhedrovirus]AAK85596.1 LEF-6 [Epiphyas postvittana nucleopolyhedrovirus]
MDLYYNGHTYNKRYTRHFVALMCADVFPHCDTVMGIDWRRSSRRRLRVHSRRVYDRLLHCSDRYFWPNGERFVCWPSRLPTHRRRMSHSPIRRRRVSYSPPNTPCVADADIESYAKSHGYDREEGEIDSVHDDN